MHKPSPSRIGFITNIAAAMGLHNLAHISPAQVLRRQRGKAPAGKRWRYSNIYWPAGEHCNVEPTRVRNPKIAENVQMMHEKWQTARAVGK